MNREYPIPQEKLKDFMSGGSMNSQYGIQLFAAADPQKARELLPPPLELADPASPMAYAYIVNIREPSFAPWYMEGGVGILAKYKEYTGVYFLGLMVSGPGALMAAFSGRESSGLPKKLCERIVVERTGDEGHCFIERGGVRLIDVKLTIGAYNEPSLHQEQEGSTPEKPVTTGGGCLLHKFDMSASGITNLHMLSYSSPTRFYSWEPASAEVALASSLNDRWGELPVGKMFGAGWMVSDNWVDGLSTIYEYPETETSAPLGLLLPGRYDRCTLELSHQRYQSDDRVTHP